MIHLVHKLLDLALNAPDVQSGLHHLVGAHDGIAALHPAVLQGATTCLLRVVRAEVLLGLLVPRRAKVSVRGRAHNLQLR